jgi:hypothetical protein
MCLIKMAEPFADILERMGPQYPGYDDVVLYTKTLDLSGSLNAVTLALGMSMPETRGKGVIEPIVTFHQTLWDYLRLEAEQPEVHPNIAETIAMDRDAFAQLAGPGYQYNERLDYVVDHRYH